MIYMRDVIASLFLVTIVGMTGCAGNTTKRHTELSPADPLAAFGDFPDSLFYGIYWNQPLNESQQSMHVNGFELVDSSGAWTFYNEEDSTSVIVPYESKVHSLKLVLRSKGYRTNQERLMTGFESAAITAAQSPEFSSFSFDLKNLDFKLTAFIQPDFIRLNFELEKHY